MHIITYIEVDLVKKKNLYLKEFCYLKGMSTKQISEMLTEQINPDDTVIADNAEPRLIAVPASHRA